MTFTEIVTEICDNLNIVSSAGQTRVGRLVNILYRTVTTKVGMQLSRRVVAVAGTTALGSRYVTFEGMEKVTRVYDHNSGSIRVLTNRTVDQMRVKNPGDGDPTEWSEFRSGANTCTIILNSIMQEEIDLHADGYETKDALSGSDEPSFPESFHDILIHGVLKEELKKKNKRDEARDAKEEYEQRLSDLRMWFAKKLREFRQGENKTRSRFGSAVGGAAGGGGAFDGTQSYEQTGLVTFHRPGVGDPPFAVHADNTGDVANLSVGLLEGEDGAHYLDRTNHTGVQAITTLSPVTTDRLIGRDTAGSGAAEHIALDTSLEFTGSQTIRRAALTGDILASAGSNATVLRDGAACSVIGRSANSTGTPADIAASTNNTILARFSNALTWVAGIVFGSGGKVDQIAFNPTQNASSDVNTLDDYEEGTWSPLIGGTGGESGQSYTTQAGTYVKIGRTVTLQFLVTLSAKGTITGNVVIGNFPFAVGFGSYTALAWAATAGNWVSIVANPLTGVTGAEIRGAAAAGVANTTNLTTTDIGNTTFFGGTIIYHV